MLTRAIEESARPSDTSISQILFTRKENNYDNNQRYC